jgi:hypothetical protein
VSGHGTAIFGVQALAQPRAASEGKTGQATITVH